MAGKTRCMMHGGKTPKGTPGNRRHGLYSTHLTEKERAGWDDIQIGSLEDELRLLRVYVAHCVALDTTAANDPGSLELTEMRTTTGESASETIVTRRPDTSGRMNWLFGRIALLERTRADLIASTKDTGADPYDQARRIREALHAMEAVEHDGQCDAEGDEQKRAIAPNPSPL
ncbi:hypothetical protein N826_07635 [Skermanella aerolata KACC 11604]|nr:hypothetical protein N826_07635 [Skermanella aerolata KACC 11604]